uniref:Oxidation resistance protein 1 n=1 Tax=Aplanochytrium stocchinoi TaxID=215587 RepID=A0A7S3UYA2_9STRA
MPYEEVDVEDEDGNITTEKIMEETPTVLIIRANGKVFGGYATQPWRHDGTTFGDARCFLFSISNDIKIPFHGRQTLPPPPQVEENEDGPRLPAFGVLRSSDNSLQFGVKDLVLNANLNECSSELEYSFGVGLARGSKESKILLAGSETFQVDEIELWAILDK